MSAVVPGQDAHVSFISIIMLSRLLYWVIISLGSGKLGISRYKLLSYFFRITGQWFVRYSLLILGNYYLGLDVLVQPTSKLV